MQDGDTGSGYNETLAGDIWHSAPSWKAGPWRRARQPDGPSAIGHHNAP
jgi:hypothetical protein